MNSSLIPPSQILVIGNYRQTLTVIRSLAKAGYRVIVGRDQKRVFTQYSRYTAEIWPHPDIEKSEQDFMAALTDFLADRRDISFIFPVGESDMLCLMHQRHRLPPAIGIIMPDDAVIAACLDKFRSYEVVARLDIPQPPFRKIYNYAEISAAVKAMGYPCVLKPNNSLTTLFDKKALIVRDAEELARAMPVWPEDNEFVVLQGYAAGYRHNCHFVADRGKLLAYFEQRVLRTDRVDGTGYGVDGVSFAPNPALQAYCESLTTALDYSGAGCAQFIVDDKTGSINFLEINPRLDATCAIPYYCGYDFPRMAVEYAAYRRGIKTAPPMNVSRYAVGRRGAWLWGDMHGWLRAMDTENLNFIQAVAWLKKMALTFFHSDFDLTWSWRDPLPNCYWFVSLTTTFLNHLTEKWRKKYRQAR